MAFEIDIEGRVFVDGIELMRLSKKEMDGVFGMITLIHMGHEAERLNKLR